jgi:hypothetical protein
MTAIAGRESGWNNDPPHTDNNGISSTGLWQINSTNTKGLTDPIGNANRAYAMAGGNSLGGLGAWALTPPGSTSIAGITQPNPYPWGTVPPVLKGDSGYYQDGTFVPHNYALTASQIAQAIYAYGQLMTFGAATTKELNGSAGWGTTGASSNAADSTAASNAASNAAAGGSSDTGSGSGCGSLPLIIPAIKVPLGLTTLTVFPGLSACNAKAIKGVTLTFVCGAGMLLGLGLVIISGFAGKGPMAPVVGAAQSYVAGAKKLPGVGGGRSRATADAGPSEASVMRSDRAILKREGAKRETSIDASYNTSGQKPLRSVKDPWDGQGMAKDA